MEINFFALFSFNSLLFVVAASACNLPPSLWCSDLETAQKCGVETQCRTWERKSELTRLEAALHVPRTTKPLNLTLAYESYCPACRHFIATQLWLVYLELKDFLTIDLLPYGNAHESYNNKTGKWIFDCIHGPKECKGNLIETCAIFITKRDEAKYLRFIDCMEPIIIAGDPVDVGKFCAKSTGLDWGRIIECVDGAEGNVYQHAIATETPKHNYVPWILLNGIHNEEIEDKALHNLKELVCSALPNPKPAPCLSGEIPEKCWNDHN